LIKENLHLRFNSYLIASLLILLLIFFINFHYYFFSVTRYYREIIGFFLFFIFFYEGRFAQKAKKTKGDYILWIYCLFAFLLIFLAVFDSGTKYYGSDDLGHVSQNIVNLDPRLYIIRNSILYLPVLLYFTFYKISRNALNTLLFFISILSPISITFFLLQKGIEPHNILSAIVQNGCDISDYNSYVPFLTFSFISSIFLIAKERAIFPKLALTASLIFTFIFILFSCSRQSVLFCFLSWIFFLSITNSLSFNKKIFMMITFILFISSLLSFLNSNYSIPKKLYHRYSGLIFDIPQLPSPAFHLKGDDKLTEDPQLPSPAFHLKGDDKLTEDPQLREDVSANKRASMIYSFIDRLSLKSSLVGNGLSSIVNAGPHNDFIRWSIRVGFIAALVGFLPFILCLYFVFNKINDSNNKNYLAFIILSVFFTLYHSFFGYPREDAFQAFFCFFGLGLCINYLRYEN